MPATSMETHFGKGDPWLGRVPRDQNLWCGTEAKTAQTGIDLCLSDHKNFPGTAEIRERVI